MRINTNEYQFSHGKKPRGRGYWMLEISASDGRGSFTTETASGEGLLSAVIAGTCADLKNRVARIKTICEVTVLP